MFFQRKKATMISRAEALPGHDKPQYAIPQRHDVLGSPLQPPFPDGFEVAHFGLGCFWGAERLFWQLDGVYSTASGYAGGYSPNPTYEEVCSGRTGHAEVVQVVYNPQAISYEDLLRVFFEAHDPTQGLRQGNDIGSQYRSAIYAHGDEQKRTAERVRSAYNTELVRSGYQAITTEVEVAGPFYYAEGYHQQYLHKVPNGYCGLAGTGVTCPLPTAVDAVAD